MASKKKKQIPSVFDVLERKNNEESIAIFGKTTVERKKVSKKADKISGIKSFENTSYNFGNNNEAYVAQKILAPLPYDQKPEYQTSTTSLFNKLKAQNEENLKKQQEQKKKTDWIDSLKDGYDFGDVTKTLLGTVGFGEYSRNEKPIKIDKESIENEYKGYTKEQLQNEQKKIQDKILSYSKNGAKPTKDKDGHYTLSGIWNTITGNNAKKLENDKEYQELIERDNALIKMMQEENIKNKKYEKGIIGTAEKTSDVIVGNMAKGVRGIEGTVNKALGRENATSEKTYAEKYSEKAISQANNKVEKTWLEIAGSMGQMMPQMVVPGGKVATTVGFANYGGSAYNEAKEQGYTEEQATKYGVVNGALEMALNKVLPSFKINGKNIYGKTASDKLTSKIMSKVLSNNAIKSAVLDASGEFTEEYLQEFLDPIVRETLLEENNNVGIKGYNGTEVAKNIAKYTAQNFFSKENLHAGILGFASSGMLGAVNTHNAYKYEKATGRNAETNLTQNEQAVIDSIVENRTEELKKQQEKVTKKDISKIEKEVRQDLERGYIETNDIERALSNEEWTKHDNNVKQKEKLENQLKELQNKKMSDMTIEEYNDTNSKISSLKEQIDAIDTDTTRNELNSSMQGKLTDNDTLLQRAYGEEIEKGNKYQFDKNEKLTEQTKKINEDIEKLGLNNNIKTRDTVDLIKKLSNETGRQYRLIDNNSAEMEKVEDKNVDGFVKNGEVFINVDSENLINRIFGHETTHLFEGTEDYTKLQNIAKEYAKTKGEYDSRKASLEEIYKDVKDANIENELTSDLVGDYLFSDIEFVRNLSAEQPNIFKRIYNHVKHLYNMATAGSKEARQLEQLKYNFEKVYRESNQSKASNNTKFALQKNINNAIKDTNSKNSFNFEKVSDETATKIKKITGIDVTNRNQVLLDSDIRHMLKEHGNEQKEKARGQIAITKNDILEIPDILKNYDKIEAGTDNKDGKTIRYKKNYSDNVTTIVEVVPKKSSLKIKTMWKTTLDNSNKAPILTSKTQVDNSTLNNKSIPQNEQKVNNDIPTKYSIQNKENNTQELDNSSFSNEKKYRGSHQIENAKAITELSINDIENRVKEVDGYLTKQSESDLRKLKKILNNSNEKVKIYRASPVNELNSGDWVTTDKSYAQNVANNNGGKVYTYEVDAKQLYYPDNVKDLPSLHRLSSFQYVEETSNTTMYSLSVKEANTGTANNGVKLSKEQQEYFKDSKVTDEDGNLITVYHTTTNEIPQFNEFNPVGTPYYRFGDQVVNYYTDSKDMSGSYASQDYKMADTKKLNNVEEAQEYLNQIFEETGNLYTLYQDEKGKWNLSQDKRLSREARDFLNSLSEEERQEMKDKIFTDDKMMEYDPDYAKVFSWNEFNKDLQDKYKSVTEKYLGSSDVVELQKEMINYLENPSWLKFENEESGTGIGYYDTEEQMLKNIKHDIQDTNMSKKSKLQYEGYVNITNPYIIDAEERNWNQVVQQSNDFIDELEERVPQDVKDNLTRLYQESANKSAEARENYEIVEQVIRQGIDGYQSAVDEEIQKANQVVKKVGFNEIEQILNDTQNTGVNPWYNIAEALQDEGVIGSATKTFIIDEFKLPKQAKEWLQENYNKGIPLHQIPTNNPLKLMEQLDRNTTPSLKDIYNKNAQNYEEFDKYRMPNSYFMEQISSEGNDYLGNELNDIFETRAEIYSPEQVGEEIAQASSVAFSKPEMIRLWGTSKTTNDIVKEVIASNKDGKTNYDGVIIRNVYDYGGKSATGTQANDLYITFNSNQFKALDNTKPTEDADIRYKLSDKRAIAPIKKNPNEVFGKEMRVQQDKAVKQAIAPLQKEVKALKQEISELKENASVSLEEFEKENKRIAPLLKEQEAPPEIIKYNDTIKDTSKLNKKELKSLSKNIKEQLGLTNKQKLDLENIIQEYSISENITKQDLFNKIKERFSKQTLETEIEDIKNVQNAIRRQKLNVSQDIKNNIADYSETKQSNFGKIRFSKDGLPVDVVYQELSEQYPSFFPDNILNETDQFLKLVEVAGLENKSIEEYKIDDDYIKEVSEYINDSMREIKEDSIKKVLEKDIKSLYKETKATSSEQKSEKLTRKEVRRQLVKEMNIDEFELSNGKDISPMNYQITDPIRVNEKVFGRELGKKINEATIEKTKHNTAEKTRWLNKERAEIKELGIKPRSKESSAVQKYGEKQYLNKYGELVPYGDKELMSEFPDAKTQEKIKKASKFLRNKYDQYIDQINETIEALGYNPIPKRKDYMRHFEELGDVFSQTGVPFNLNDMKAEDLPTDINGLTEFNKPGKNWFASSQKRYGSKTNYDAITGIDGYLEGAGNLIYHTEDIQRYRALSTLIRDTYGQTKGYENLEGLSNEQVQERIKDIQSNKLSKYVAWLDEQANSLAGKKGAIDRGIERAIGRRAYTTLNTIKKQTGSNMTGLNVRSAMTNFISTTIASSKTNKIAFAEGIGSTIKNMFHKDNFIDKSDFLTSRLKGDSQISKKTWQKLSNAGQIFMSGSDWITSNVIVRSKYFEGLHKGMTETQAIKYADDFASRVMGDRSQGSTAEVFNSKTLGILTQFQLEVNNQWQYMLHDSKMDYQAIKAKSNGINAGATIVFQMGQLAGFSYLFNEVFEKLTGSRAAFDPIEIIKELFGLGDDDEDKTQEERMQSAISTLLEAVPFSSLFTQGGRLPISEMLEPFSTTFKAVSGGKDKYGNTLGIKDIPKSIAETAPYYLLPTGYSQIKKTKKGLSMFSKDKEIKGSYTDNGNLRFPVKDTTTNKIKAGLFGQWSSKEAQDYIKIMNSGIAPLNEKQTDTFKKLSKQGVSIEEYRNYKKKASAIYKRYDDYDKCKSLVANEIKNMNISDEAKYILYNSSYNKKGRNLGQKLGLNADVYLNYASQTFESDKDENGNTIFGSKRKKELNYIKSMKASDEIKYALYNENYNKDNKLNIAEKIGVPADKYFDYVSKTFKADKDKNGKSISGTKKKKIANYLNSMDINYGQKAILFKIEYPNDNSYNNIIVNYLNKSSTTYDEEEYILKKLGFKVKKDGTITWD